MKAIEKAKKYRVGFTAGVFDMFHVGHLNILKRAKEQCDFLIVGVSTDEVVKSNKGKDPIIPFGDRFRIVEAIKYVDKAIPQESYDVEGKIKIALMNGIDVMFVGSDWKGTQKWCEIERRLKNEHIDLVFLPHTDGVSSSMLRKKIEGK